MSTFLNRVSAQSSADLSYADRRSVRSLPSLGHAERVEQSTCSHSIATWQMMGPEQVGEVAGLYPFHSRTSSAAVATTTRTITTYELRATHRP